MIGVRERREKSVDSTRPLDYLFAASKFLSRTETFRVLTASWGHEKRQPQTGAPGAPTAVSGVKHKPSP